MTQLQINRFFLFSFLAFLLLPGCMRENLSDCVEEPKTEVSLTFLYDYHLKNGLAQPENLFKEEVQFLDLFVFDKQGDLVLEKTVRSAEMSDDNSIDLNLAPGEYDLITWGNANAEDYLYWTKEETGERFLDLITDVRGLVNSLPEALFHGKFALNVVEGKTLKEEVPLVKKTSHIHIYIEGVQLQGVDPSEEEDIVIRFEADNGRYTFDGVLTDEKYVIYIPHYATLEGGLLHAEAILQKILIDREVRLVIRQANRYDLKAFFDVSLVDLFSEKYEDSEFAGKLEFDEYLDRKDEFEIHLEVELQPNGEYRTMNVVVNDWEPIETPGVGI